MSAGSAFPLHNKKPNLPHQMDNLSHDVLRHILSRLPISSLIRFQYVCRSWRLLAQNPQFLDQHENFRCLIFHCDYPIRNHLCFVDFPAFKQQKQPVKRISTPFSATMPEYDVVGSCNGFLCLSDSLYNEKLFIYNPFTREYLELPKTKEFPNPDVVCGIGFHPQTKQFKVIKIVYSRGFRRIQRRVHHSEVQIFTLGSSNWRSVGRISHHLAHGQSQAIVNGRLHWVSLPRRHHHGRTIVSFDLATEEFIDIPKPDYGSLSRCNYHLVILNGCLSAAVYCTHGKMEIWVMEQYGVKESWVKRFNIGTYMPKSIKQEASEISFKVSKIVLRSKIVKVVCILKSGELLLEYRNRALVLFNPTTGKFKDVIFEGMPNWFHTVVHFASLNRIDSLFE
ncbi:F-box protein At3g07870-like [Cucurbita pepo subsp. pepo]|uniref:F-box protein At3g07870-like n=1 Tax=Cucurbita pepo subsp. pepo TaxID=3664 RepID=UPI000C9D9B50|nr:F-box protein At3g07870-like [Cucurbita pepo subsp. pepo]